MTTGMPGEDAAVGMREGAVKKRVLESGGIVRGGFGQQKIAAAHGAAIKPVPLRRFPEAGFRLGPEFRDEGKGGQAFAAACPGGEQECEMMDEATVEGFAQLGFLVALGAGGVERVMCRIGWSKRVSRPNCTLSFIIFLSVFIRRRLAVSVPHHGWLTSKET